MVKYIIKSKILGSINRSVSMGFKFWSHCVKKSCDMGKCQSGVNMPE